MSPRVFSQAEDQLRTAELPGSEPAAIREQLKEARALSDDISAQKGRVRDVLASAKKLVRDAAQYDDVSEIREKADKLKDISDAVSLLRDKRSTRRAVEMIKSTRIVYSAGVLFCKRCTVQEDGLMMACLGSI